MTQKQIETRFESYTPIFKLFVYALALKEERYELLAVLDKCVDEEFRNSVPTALSIIETAEPQLFALK